MLAQVHIYLILLSCLSGGPGVVVVVCRHYVPLLVYTQTQSMCCTDNIELCDYNMSSVACMIPQLIDTPLELCYSGH